MPGLESLLRNPRRLAQFASTPGQYAAALDYASQGSVGRRPASRSYASKKADEPATLKTGEYIEQVELPDGSLVKPATESGKLVKVPGKSNLFVDPANGEPYQPDGTQPTGIRSAWTSARQVTKGGKVYKTIPGVGEQEIGPDPAVAADAAKAEAKRAAEYRRLALAREKRPYNIDRVTGEPVPLQTDEEWAATKQAKAAKLDESARVKRLKDQADVIDLEADRVSLTAPKPAKEDEEAFTAAEAALSPFAAGQNMDEVAAKYAGAPANDEASQQAKAAAENYLAYKNKVKPAREAEKKVQELKLRALDIKEQIINPQKWKEGKTASLAALPDDDLVAEVKAQADIINEQEEKAVGTLDFITKGRNEIVKELNDFNTTRQRQAAAGMTAEEIQAADHTAATMEQALAEYDDWNSEAKAESDAALKAAADRRDVLKVAGAEIDRRHNTWARPLEGKWGEMQKGMLDRASSAGIPKPSSRNGETPGRALQIEAFHRLDSMGIKKPRFINQPNEPEGDRAGARDIENIIAGLDEAAQQASTPEKKAALTKEKAYWQNEAKSAMTAEQWTAQTGEPDLKYPQEKAAILAKAKPLYEGWAKGLYSEDWQAEEETPRLVEEAAKAGLDVASAKEALQTYRQLDWSNPRRDPKTAKPITEAARLLPNGEVTVNPSNLLDPEAYDAAVDAMDTTPEAKARAKAMRADLALPVAEEAYNNLRKNSDFAAWLDENTTGTPLQRMEKFNAEMKSGGALNASLMKFLGSAAGLPSGWLGTVAGLTGSDKALEYANYWQDRAQAYGTAAGEAGKGTNMAGRFMASVAGGLPSVMESMAVGGIAGRVLGSGAAALGLAAVDAAAQSGGGTFVDAVDAYVQQGMTPEEAKAKAAAPAIASGLVTGVLTAIGGGGVESLLRVEGRELAKSALKRGLKAMVAREVVEGTSEEALEEWSDQLLQGVIAQASYAPNKPVEQILSEAIEAGLVGGVLGGGASGIRAYGDARNPQDPGTASPEAGSPAMPVQPRPAGPAPTPAPATAQDVTEQIAKFNPTGATALPKAVSDTAKSTGRPVADVARQAVSGAIKIAQGAKLEDLDAREREALGFINKDGKIVAAPKTTPLVEIHKGELVIRNEVAEWLTDEAQEGLAGLVNLTEAERKAQIDAEEAAAKAKPAKKKAGQAPAAKAESTPQNSEVVITGDSLSPVIGANPISASTSAETEPPKSSQTITGSNAEMAAEMPVPEVAPATPGEAPMLPEWLKAPAPAPTPSLSPAQAARATPEQKVRAAKKAGKVKPPVEAGPEAAKEKKSQEVGENVDKTPKSSTQLTLSKKDAAPILGFGKTIPESELYASVDPEWSDGALETDPHVTVLYGLTKHEAAPVEEVIQGHGPITIKLGKLSLFESADYDVLKVDIEGESLRALNAKVSKLPNANTFPDYKPHMTIAYLKKGEGKKYVGDTRFEGKEITFDTMTFSPPKELRGEKGKPELALTTKKEPAPDQEADSNASTGGQSDEGSISPVAQQTATNLPQEPAQASQKEASPAPASQEAGQAEERGILPKTQNLKRGEQIRVLSGKFEGIRKVEGYSLEPGGPVYVRDEETGMDVPINAPWETITAEKVAQPPRPATPEGRAEAVLAEYEATVRQSLVGKPDKAAKDLAGRKLDLAKRLRARLKAMTGAVDYDVYAKDLREKSGELEVKPVGRKGSILFINPEKLIDRLTAKHKTTEAAREAMDVFMLHEFIHKAAIGNMDGAKIIGLYNLLTPEAKAASKALYLSDSGLTDFWQDDKEFAAAHEWFAQLVEARLRGKISNQAEIEASQDPAFRDRLLALLKDFVAQLRDIAKLVTDKAQAARIEAEADAVQAIASDMAAKAGLELGRAEGGQAEAKKAAKGDLAKAISRGAVIVSEDDKFVITEKKGIRDNNIYFAYAKDSGDELVGGQPFESLAKARAFMGMEPAPAPPAVPEVARQADSPAGAEAKTTFRTSDGREGISAVMAFVSPEADLTPPQAAAVAKEEAMPEPAKQAAPFDATAAKGQKKFLLAEVAAAVKAAPRRAEMSKEQKDAISQLEALPAEMEKASDKNNIADIRRRLDAAKAQAERLIGYVTIEVPGDGTFTILNEKEALYRFQKRADKFPVTQSRDDLPAKPTAQAPTAVPALKKAKTTADVVAAMFPMVSTDEKRPAYQKVIGDGTHLWATDGRVLVRVEQENGGGKGEEAVVYDEKGNAQPWDAKQRVPAMSQVIPDDKAFKPYTLDTARWFSLMSQARAVIKDLPGDDASGLKSVILYRNPDGSLGVFASDMKRGDYAHNIQPEAKILAAYSPDYFQTILRVARNLGHEQIELRIQDDISPATLRAGNALFVLMPMRVSGAPAYSTARPAPPVTAEPSPAAQAPAEAPEAGQPAQAPAEGGQGQAEDKPPVGGRDEPAPPAITAPGVRYNDIPLELARRAHMWTSFVPEVRARGEQRQYVDYMNNVWAALEKEADTDEKKAQAKEQFEIYRARYVEKNKDLLRSHAGLLSAMITGPAKFPVAKAEKRNNAYNNKLKDFIAWDKKAKNAMLGKVNPQASGIISADDANAPEQIQARIDELKARQEMMKKGNALIKKNAGDKMAMAQALRGIGVPESEIKSVLFPPQGYGLGWQHFTLTNNNANIRRNEERLERMQSLRARPTQQATFDGGRVEENTEANRVQILFDSKPPADMIAKLKANGFKWAPSQGAWQRQRTPNAVRAAESVLGVKMATPVVEAVPEAAEEAEFGPATPTPLAEGSQPADKGQPAGLGLPPDPPMTENMRVGLQMIRNGAKIIKNPFFVDKGQVLGPLPPLAIGPSMAELRSMLLPAGTVEDTPTNDPDNTSPADEGQQRANQDKQLLQRPKEGGQRPAEQRRDERDARNPSAADSSGDSIRPSQGQPLALPPRGVSAEDAKAKGYTLKAYRGVSQQTPFNDSDTVWATTNKDVADSYAVEVFGYDDPEVMELLINPSSIPRTDLRKLTDEERESMEVDSFGNPQKIGIYANSDDSPLGSSYPQTAIHAPKSAALVKKDDGLFYPLAQPALALPPGQPAVTAWQDAEPEAEPAQTEADMEVFIAEQQAIAEEEEAARQALRNDPDAIDAVQASGKMSGRNLSKQFEYPEARAVYQALTAARDQLGGPETVQLDKLRKWAKETFESDPEKYVQWAADMAEDNKLLDVDEQAVLGQAFQFLTREARLTGDKNIRALLNKVGNYYLDTGTRLAQAMSARRDPLETPQERWTKALDIVFGPSEAVRRKLRILPTEAGKARRIASLEAELAEARGSRRADVEAALKTARAQETKEELLEKDDAESQKIKERVLKNIGVTEDDLMLSGTDRVAMHSALLDLPAVKAGLEAYKGKDNDGYNIMRLAFRGFSDEHIANALNLNQDDVGQFIHDATNAIIRPAVAEQVKAGTGFGGLIKAGFARLKKAVGLGLPPKAIEDQPSLAKGTRQSVGDVTAEVNRVMAYALQSAKARNSGKLMSKVVMTPGGQRVRVFVPFDPDDAANYYAFAREYTAAKASKFDKLYEYWINWPLLSGPQTQVANITGNAAQVAWHYTGQRLAEATLNLAYQDPNSAQFREFKHVLKGFWQGIGPAYDMARQTFLTEGDTIRHKYLGQPLEIDVVDGDLDKVGNIRASVGGTAGRINRLPGRVLRFTDAFFKTSIMYAEASAVAYRRAHVAAKAQGLKGKARADFIDTEIANTINDTSSAVWGEVMKTAEELLFQDDNSATEIVDTVLGGYKGIKDLEKLLAEAEAKGDSDTAAKLQKRIRSRKFIGSLMRWIFPFQRTPTNIIRTGIKKAGGSAISLLYGLTRAGWLAMGKDGVPMIKSYSKAAQIKDASETLLAGLGWLALASMLEGDDDDDKKKVLLVGTRSHALKERAATDQFLRKYGGENSIVWQDGNGKVLGSLPFGRYEPAATLLTTWIDAYRNYQEVKRLKSQGENASYSTYMLSSLVSSMEDKSFLQGFSNAMQFMRDVEEKRENPDESAGLKMLMNNVFPNLIKQPLRNMDDVLRERTTAGVGYAALPNPAMAPKLPVFAAQPKISTTGERLPKAFVPAARLLFQANTKVTPQPDALLYRANRLHPTKRWSPQPLNRDDYTANPPGKAKPVPITDPAKRRQFAELAGRLYAAKAAQVAAKAMPSEKAAPGEGLIKAFKKAREDAMAAARAQAHAMGLHKPTTTP